MKTEGERGRERGDGGGREEGRRREGWRQRDTKAH